MKYIDADKLIAEIESRMEDCKLPDGKFPTTTNIVRYEELSCLRNSITSLQQEQPEVDLEKEMDKFYGVYRDDNGKTYDVEDNESCFDWKEDEAVEHELRFARYFYELGKIARKEE